MTKGQEVFLELDVFLALWAEAVRIKDRWVAETLQPGRCSHTLISLLEIPHMKKEQTLNSKQASHAEGQMMSTTAVEPFAHMIVESGWQQRTTTYCTALCTAKAQTYTTWSPSLAPF